MKKGLLLLFCLVNSFALFAQEKMYIHTSENVTLGALISDVDSVYFGNDGYSVYFEIGDSLVEFGISEIDSISFGDDSETVSVVYNGSSVSVINPLAFEGVSVNFDGADVVVNSLLDDRKIDYELSGSTSDGMFKIYSDYKYNLILNGVNITNTDGAAINIQSGKKCDLILEDGTVNTLEDGSSYAESEEDEKSALFSEGQIIFSGTGSLNVTSNSKHAICSDDYISVEEGTITVASAAKDGIHVNDYFEMSGGTLNIKATGDGIDGDEGYILITGGEITISCASSDVKGITCDSVMTISGGTIDLTINGDQSKGLKSGQSMFLEGGDISITTSGNAVLESSGSGYDPSYCSAIKCDEDVYATGADITVTSTGKAGKGISCDGTVSITSGTIGITTTGSGATYKNSSGVTDAYTATGISVDENLSIDGGNITVSCSGAGGKGISADGAFTVGESGTPVINVTTSGSKIQISSSDYAEAKAVKVDGAATIENGTVTISSADDGIKSEQSVTINGGDISITKSVEGVEAPIITVNDGNVSVVASDDAFNATYGNGSENNDGSYIYLYGGYVVLNTSAGDGLDSNGNIQMTGGTVVVHGPQSSPEVGIDVNGTFNENGGFLIVSAPNSNMVEGPATSSTQYSLIATTSTNLSTSTLFHIQDSQGNSLVSFKAARTYSAIVFSSSSLKSGSTYSIYTGGTCTGTETDGLYSGGTYSGGTLKKSFTVSGKVTKVSF